MTDGAVTLSGLAEKVVALTTYKPTAKSATPAPVAPSDEDGKSPASTVVEMARLRARASLLSVED